jgi:hypothetical protein
MPRPEVRDTEEYRRVRDLSRRRLTQADAEAWAEALTPEVLQPGARARLRPWQACSIAEVVENDGGLLGLPVGAGKTLPTYLIPRLFNSRRPLLIVPAALRDKTRHDFATYVGTWRAPNPPPSIVSREELAPESGAHILTGRKPDLIIIDEAHKLANSNSAACRRLDRYIVANRARYTRDDPEWVRVVCMTGTLSRKSLMGYWHLLCWCLDDRAPVPLIESEARMWAAALDEQSGRFGAQRRPLPGPLGATRAAALDWFRTRLLETPGVVIVDGDSCTTPLVIRQRLAQECPDIDEMFKRLYLENGEIDPAMIVSDPLSRWRVDGWLGCGVYQKYEPPPPQEWRDTRRAIAAFVRETIEHSNTLDTEGQVLRRYADDELVQRWKAIKPTFKPERHTKAVWFSTATIESALEWLHASPEPAIVWSGNTEFGRSFADVARLSYYGEGGTDQNGRGLHIAPPDRSMVVSWHSGKEGFNLQAWRRHLVVHPPQSALYLEQLFGRPHRSGQDRAVVIDVLCTSGGTLDAFDSAVGEAHHVKRSVSMTQKLLRAKVERVRPPKVTRSNRFRWARKGDLDCE